jgi:hypothetical protein
MDAAARRFQRPCCCQEISISKVFITMKISGLYAYQSYRDFNIISSACTGIAGVSVSVAIAETPNELIGSLTDRDEAEASSSGDHLFDGIAIRWIYFLLDFLDDQVAEDEHLQ